MTIQSRPVSARKLWLGAASLMAMIAPTLAAFDACAQDTDGATEVIVKAPRRTAAEAARVEQKNAQGVTSVISGEELRDQPQANLADLLTRLPGLSSSSDMSRLQAGTGEAQYVSIRGLDTAYNASSFDGVRMPQTDANTRAISMNLLSPFGISVVRVEKAPTAEEDGDAIAGNIDFRSSTAFDYRQNTFQMRTSLQSAELASDAGQDHLGYALQVEGARFSHDKRFGLYASAYYATKDTAGQSVAMQSDWEKLNNNLPGTVRQNEDNLTGQGVQWNFFRNQISRMGATVNFDFHGEVNQFYWHTTAGQYSIESDLDQASIRRNLPSAAGQINPNPGNGSYDANGIRADYGIMAGGYHRNEDSDQVLFTTKLGGNTKFNTLTLDYHIAYNKGAQVYPNRIEAAFYGLPYIGTPDQTGLAKAQLQISTNDSKDPRAILTPEALTYLNAPQNTRQWYISGGFDKAWERKREAGLEANWAVEKGPLSAIRGGFKYETSERFKNTVEGDANRYIFPGGSFAAGQAPYWNPQGTPYATVAGETLTTFVGLDPQVPLRLVDSDLMKAQAAQYAYSQPWSELDLKRNKVNGEEDRTSYYVQAELNWGNLQIIPGLRYEDNSFKATYWQSKTVGETDASGFVTSDRQYSETLPSIVASYRPNNSTVYRAVLRKSYSRPSFDLLFGPTTISYDTDGVTPLSVYQPNPDLKPVEAVNLDLSAEFYTNHTDFVTVTAYYKDLSNVIYATGTTNAEGSYNIANNPSTNVNGVELTSLNNAGSGSVFGIELAGKYALKGLPVVLDGLSIGANLTLQDPKAKVLYGGEYRDELLPNAPKVMYNIEATYYKNALTMVLNYNYMGLRQRDIRSSRPDTFSQPTKHMNFVASYQLDNGVTLGASVENLLNDYSYWATTGKGTSYLTADRNGGYVQAGRTFLVNLSYKR